MASRVCRTRPVRVTAGRWCFALPVVLTRLPDRRSARRALSTIERESRGRCVRALRCELWGGVLRRGSSTGVHVLIGTDRIGSSLPFKRF